VPESTASIGVACVTCHVLGNDIVGSPRLDPPEVRAAATAHPVLRDARFASTAACASCHEFEFPDGSARSLPELMQSTLNEHARSAERDRSCASCHMPVVAARAGNHRSHVFAGGRDAALVQSALAVTAERSPKGVRLSLTPRQVGHAFPTGDLFRRLEVSAEVVGPEWQVLASAHRYLSRHWARQPSPFGVVLRKAVSDDRPLAATIEVELELGVAAASKEIGWRVAYQRVAHPRSDLEQDSVVEGEIEIASGTVKGNP
jgi:hypothetical protein